MSTTSTGATLVDKIPDGGKATTSSVPAATEEATKRRNFIHMFHKKETLTVPKERGKEPYSDIGKSELTLELLDKTRGARSSEHMLDGAALEPPKYPALDIKNLPQETLPGSDKTTFAVTRQSVSESTAGNIRTLQQEVLSSSLDLTMMDDPKENVEKFPDLNPSIVPPPVEESNSTNFDGVFDSLQYETETFYKNDVDPKKNLLDSDYDTIFTPIYFMLSIEPRISGCIDKKLYGHSIIGATVQGEVGQKLNDDALEDEHQGFMVNGLYNFAKLANFEDMVELPGTAVTSVASWD
jgi:hypothetical protein